MASFTHLHVHTQYSILDGACAIDKLMARVKALGMDSIAITDHGNMYGVLGFYNAAVKNGIKPILGCEMYVARGSRLEKTPPNRSGHHLILLAKNETGYANLIKLNSLAFDKEAYYYTSRIDKELLFQHRDGLICCSACLGGEIPSLILSQDYEAACETAKEYKAAFGEDYYLELQRHGHADQEVVNKALARMATELDIPIIASNDVHFIESSDYDAHKILICLNTNRKLDDETDLFYTGQEYLKSPEEMSALFPEFPEAITNTQAIKDKIELFPMERSALLPRFEIPTDFLPPSHFAAQYPEDSVSAEDIAQRGSYEQFLRVKYETAYLRFLVEKGAVERYGESLSDDLKERIAFELDTIEWMGFPGYFLIVQDFIAEARNNLDVIVGPGRGSAAGSVVAYCLGITNIDPIKYHLLFERFLNPERISLPDVDVDFDDEGRGRVINYVQNKYGADHVAQIVTFGSMAAKSAIKDVARVLELPLSEANRLAKLVPNDPKITLAKAFAAIPELRDAKEKGGELVKRTLQFAEQLEGSVRNTGVHACGMIIAPESITNYVPIASAKDSDMPVVQFEGTLIESVGMIKMDFLGLKTLSIIKDTCSYVRKNGFPPIDIDHIALDDSLTFALYQKGDTIGTFQFESPGMRQHLQDLRPDCFEDLIAMNALYRPGPMQYIPSYIARKHGKEKINYEFPFLEEYLSETYGITVYQEQVMLLSQRMANFTKGEADKLRKAMGKKQIAVMEQLKEKFVTGCQQNGLEETKIQKIWADWEKFAEYAFNKSHSTCYAYIAYQTAYLKAHYPAQYMASVLTHNLSDISKITFYIDECLRQNIPVAGPDLNESDLNFMVGKDGVIRFGLAAIKGVGEAAAQEIIQERESRGAFRSLYDFVERVNLRTVNRRCLEALAKAGALDSFCKHRAQFFVKMGSSENDPSFLESMLRYGNKYQGNLNSSQGSLFGEETPENAMQDALPDAEEWTKIEQLRYEKEMIGFYLSGHPLEIYKHEVRFCANTRLMQLNEEPEKLQGKEILIACMVAEVSQRYTKGGDAYLTAVLEDYDSSFSLSLFKESFLKHRHLFEVGNFLFLKGAMVARWQKDGDPSPRQYEFRASQVSLLSEVMENTAKTVTILIAEDKLNSETVKSLTHAVLQCKGKAKLRFQVFDWEKGIELNMKPVKAKVNPKTFLTAIESHPAIFKYHIEKH